MLPKVPVRQWVCSFPWQLGYDAKLRSAVLAALRRSLRRRDLPSVVDAQFGALTFIQRADSSLRLNVHYHCLVLDSVHVRDPEGPLHFHVPASRSIQITSGGEEPIWPGWGTYNEMRLTGLYLGSPA